MVWKNSVRHKNIYIYTYIYVKYKKFKYAFNEELYKTYKWKSEQLMKVAEK